MNKQTNDFWTSQAKTGKVERLTPENVLKHVREQFEGQIGLDPCGHPDSLVDARTTYLLPQYDGLSLPWRGHDGVFANVPYGRKLTTLWVEKMRDEFHNAFYEDTNDELITLLPARMGANWTQDLLLPYADSVVVWRGRLVFKGKGLKGDSAKFDSLLAYYGNRPRRFARIFGAFGWVATLRQKEKE